MSLETPLAIRTLQRKLYRKAKAARHKVAGRGTKRFSCDIVYMGNVDSCVSSACH